MLRVLCIIEGEVIKQVWNPFCVLDVVDCRQISGFNLWSRYSVSSRMLLCYSWVLDWSQSILLAYFESVMILFILFCESVKAIVTAFILFLWCLWKSPSLCSSFETIFMEGKICLNEFDVPVNMRSGQSVIITVAPLL